jgi:hypothetical protein
MIDDPNEAKDEQKVNLYKTMIGVSSNFENLLINDNNGVE